jgi:predicted Zn-dependent peptidase
VLAEQVFGDLPAAAPAPPEPARYVGGVRLERRRDLEQVHLCLGWEGLPWHDPDHWALQVLSTALGGGMSSRLFQELRENRALCYSVFSFNSAYADSGLFGVYAGTGAGDVAELLDVAIDQTAELVDAADEGEIARAKAQLKASLLMGLESCSAVCEEMARQILCYGRRLSTREVLDRIAEVDAATVRRVGRRVLAGRPATLAALGPLRKLPTLRTERLVN